MPTRREWNADEFSARLEKRLHQRRQAKSAVTAEREQYRQVAALLRSFDPTTLRRSADDTAVGGAVLQLVDDCEAKSVGPTATWTLKPEVRRATLASFSGPADAQRALAANIARYAEGSAEHRAMEYLSGRGPALDGLDVAALLQVVEAVGWLSHVPGMSALPADEELKHRLDRRRLVEPLESLLHNQFEGRVKELDLLREYVGVQPASTVRGKLASVGRAVSRRLGSERTELPLVVYGPGGVGKSTLLARFLLDHVEDQEKPFPFSYIDFERVTISINEPTALLAEMARQLAVQYRGAAPALTKFADQRRVAARQQRNKQEQLQELHEIATTRAALGRAARHRSHIEARAADGRAAMQLGELVRRAIGWTPGDERPFLIVLDSFEEAQYRSSPVLGRMWAMFDGLHEAFPRTRVVVAGRAPVGHPRVPAEEILTLELGELDRAAAVKFLLDRRVAMPVAEALVERIGGNPLSLSLAATVATQAGDEDDDGTWVKTLPSKRRQLFGSVDEMLIQGLLYDRLLKHIPIEELRRLAHPGLVLRRLTPAILQEVLAPHCNVQIPNIDRARELLAQMARLSLVEQVAPEVLRHRPDVRRVMLRLSEKDKPALARKVELEAVEFYAKSETEQDRAEEIYHRLRLTGSPRVIESRWLPEVGIYLEGAAPELPPRSRRLLARLLQNVPADLVREADQVEWERRTAAEVEDLLAQGYVDQALAMLGQRRPWTTCSPLHALLVDALLRKSELAQARRAVAEALDDPGTERCGDTYLELLLLSAQIAEQEGNTDGADCDLRQAESVATHLGKDFDALGAMLQRARLHRAVGSPDQQEIDLALAHKVESLPAESLSSRPTLLRAVAAEVGEHEPRVLAQAIDLVGLPESSPQTLRSIATAIVPIALNQVVLPEVLAFLDRKFPELLQHPETQIVLRLLDEARRDGVLNELVKELLTIRDDSGILRSAIAAAMSEEASSQTITGRRTIAPPAASDSGG